MNLQFFMVLCLELSIGIYGKRRKILNGQNTVIDEYPYMASLRLKTPHFHFCGGAIISNTHILTAAHCINDKEANKILVYTGSSKIKPLSGYAHVVLQIEAHPLFEESKKSNNDIAVIVLKKSIKFSRYQNKIDLPLRQTYDNEIATFIGWGKTSDSSIWTADILQEGFLKIMNIFDCRKSININLYDEQICANSVMNGVRTSPGDSGGPLVFNGQIIGIASRNFPSNKDFPDIFTNVFAYLNFIKSIIEK